MKRGTKMMLLVLALAILLGGYVSVRQMNQTESVTETSGVFALTDKTDAEIASLRWTKGEEAFSFVKQDGQWMPAEEPAWPVQQDTLNALAERLLSLQGTRKLEDIKELSDYGLAEPAIIVTAAWTDGSETSYVQGDATPFADGYYLLLSGQDGEVYTINTSLSSIFEYTRTELAVLEELSSVENVHTLSVSSGLHAVKAEKSITIDPNQLWYDEATEQPLDQTKMETLIQQANDIVWDELITAAADGGELTAWQLDDTSAVTLTLTGDTERVILLGTQQGTTAYYARLPGSAMVYSVDSDAIDNLLSASRDTLALSDLIPLSYADLQTAELMTGKGSYKIEKTASEEDAETQSFKENLWAQVMALKVKERLNEGSDGDQLLSIHAVNTEGTETTLLFSEYDAASYQVTVDGGMPVLVDAAVVDALIRSMRANQ